MAKSDSTGLRRCAAEFIGTFLLVFAGPGAVVIDAVSDGRVTSLGIGLSFGLAVMAAIYAVGHISGAHINPAVTVAFALTRHFPWTQVPAYVVAQLLGAATASATLLALFGDVADLGATVPSGSPLQVLGLELILTLFLMFVVAAVATDVRAAGQAAAIAIGGYVALAATFVGASMNPARSFGPALLSGAWSHHWVYWVGPLSGAIMGAFLYRYTCASRTHPNPSAKPRATREVDRDQGPARVP